MLAFALVARCAKVAGACCPLLFVGAAAPTVGSQFDDRLARNSHERSRHHFKRAAARPSRSCRASCPTPCARSRSVIGSNRDNRSTPPGT